jgi:hypothetical protein
VRSVRRNSDRFFGNPKVGYAAALIGCLLTAKPAAAEVTLIKTDNNWEVYLAGRVGAFFSYAVGDSYPVPAGGMNGKIVSGGGLDEKNLDLIPATDAMGQPDLTKQGTINRMRIRSGMLPNILSLGVRKRWADDLTFHAQVSLWGTIEPDAPLNNPRLGKGQLPRPSGPDEGVTPDFREGFLELSGSFGTVTGGRFLTLFSRGAFEADLMYGHGYGVGFPGVRVQPASGGNMVAGGLSRPGPTGGMAGFGSLGPGYAAGLVYATPSLGGLKVSAGIFDAAQLYSTPWSTTRTPRPEGELAYDLASGSTKVHLYANGAYQKLYDPVANTDTSMYGAGYGGRLEVGPVHLAVNGFIGKGVGLYYAFDGTPTSASSAPAADGKPTNEIRTFRGYSALAQLALGSVDLGVGAGQTQVLPTDLDKLDGTDSVIKTQTGISASVVYHATENLHLDLDFFNASFVWSLGEKQKDNLINAGATFTF